MGWLQVMSRLQVMMPLMQNPAGRAAHQRGSGHS